jgi:nickel-dependent lactate racemase
VSSPESVASVLTESARGRVTADDLRQFIVSGLSAAGLERRSVLVVVPDATRTVPLPEIFAAVHEALAGRVSRLNVVIALGTHRAMTEAELDAHFGVEPGGWDVRYPGVGRHNHAWWDPSTFRRLGTLGREEVRDISGGLLDEPIPVRLNQLAVEHDVVIIAGPVFPHEVVGFSGGTKYLFPGIGGPEMIDTSHWLGALIGVHDVIGVPGVTPVRALIDRAASLLPTRQLCLAMVVADGTAVHGAFLGEPRAAWAEAAALSARTHIEYVPRPYRRVLSIVPPMYEDLWTAAKGFYKLDPVTADGGEIVLLAPHLSEVSVTHGEHIEQVGYHCRDYLLGHLSRFRAIPRAVLAHSAHLRGKGTWSPETGERCRIGTVLATGIPADLCHALNLGHHPPQDIDVEAWAEAEDTLVVRKAGEHLYRLAEGGQISD